jgi:hypothetical protein
VSCEITGTFGKKRIMDYEILERFKHSFFLYVVLLLNIQFGCSRDAPSPVLDILDLKQTETVSTEGFSFVYKGPRPTTFSEAPELAKRVALGELPPLDNLRA